MKHISSLSAAVLLVFTAFTFPLSSFAADTLRVERATLYGPVTVQNQCYAVDSVDMRGNKVENDEVFLLNAKAFATSVQHRDGVQVAYGEAVARKGDASLSCLRFRVRTDRWVKAHIDVAGFQKWRLYDMRGNEIQGGSITQLPSDEEYALVTYTTADTDTFRVSITGESLAGVTINSELPRPFTWMEQATGPRCYHASLSPSGRYAIAEYYNTRGDGRGEYWSTISDLQTGKTLLRTEGGIRSKWMEDKDVLYYVRERDGKKQFVTLNPVTQVETILAEDVPSDDVTLSPTGDYFLYYKDEDGNEVTRGLKYLEHPDDRQPHWRTRHSLYRCDIATGIRQRLTYGRETVSLADISSDGRRLLLSFSRFDATRLPFDRTTIVEMDVMTGRVDTVLLDAEFLRGDYCYLPGDKDILVNGTANAFNNLCGELPEGRIANEYHMGVFVYNLASRTATYALPKGFKPSVIQTSVCVGDNAVYMLTEDGINQSVYRLDCGTRKVSKVNIPISYVSRFDVASHQKNPRIVAIGQDKGERSRLCYAGQAGKMQPFGDIHPEDVHRGVEVAKCTTWQFRASRGDSIQCFYYTPCAAATATKPLPMIVYYYGGCSPVARVAESSYPFQVWASQGYYVLVVEPSGASGFGHEFASRHVGTWGEGSSDDIIEAVKQFCREHPEVDATKVGCAGASYGGFMTQYLQTKTDIFAAACSHAGISNIASYWGGGYWGYSYGQVAEYGQYPWSDRELFVEHSPLFNADKIHTPLLLLHGTADNNVPTTESLQLYTALKILGREVALVTVDGEDHGVANYQKRQDWAATMQAWFAKWLKGQPEWWESLYPAAKK